MISVTFKHVGQGDCILLEWENEGAPKIGIIDCNAIGAVNVVTSYLQTVPYPEIEFIILSHPHADHFSGLLDILKFCASSNIPINMFAHTCWQMPQVLAIAVKEPEEKNLLSQLFRFVRNIGQNTIIHEEFLKAKVKYQLNRELSLEVLSPKEEELNEVAAHIYGSTRKDDKDILRYRNNRKANLLSSVIKLSWLDRFILLTADAERKTLKRIGLTDLKKDRSNILLGQAPHHGSIENHYKAFWANRQHSIDTPVAITCTTDSRHHPAPKVVDDFRSLQYLPKTTGHVTGLQTQRKQVVRLNIVSKPQTTALPTGQDLKFVF